MFHRSGWCYRPKASSLTRVREDSIFSGHQVVEKIVIDRIGLVVVKEF
jgi:hypothetical protein